MQVMFHCFYRFRIFLQNVICRIYHKVFHPQKLNLRKTSGKFSENENGLPKYDNSGYSVNSGFPLFL